MHIFDIKGDVLFRLPADLIFQFLRSHGWQGYFTDNHRITGN
ncbi:hypothetical protein SDC9_177987 [bioreactor metagenome]|uniref:Uncharacterized protein n=1 Tax=bioreactor metagenome TaxID=1076179 RepID=A0A645GW77_9ZZZZ